MGGKVSVKPGGRRKVSDNGSKSRDRRRRETRVGGKSGENTGDNGVSSTVVVRVRGETESGQEKRREDQGLGGHSRAGTTAAPEGAAAAATTAAAAMAAAAVAATPAIAIADPAALAGPTTAAPASPSPTAPAPHAHAGELRGDACRGGGEAERAP
ncbi:unnamed protein product [Closterium sp. NIES-54]